MVLQVERVVALHRMHQTIDDRFVWVLLFERAKHSIPDDENAGVVLVNVLWVAAVMHSMMTRRVQNVLERAERGDHFGVQPKHIQFAELQMGQEDAGRNAR